MRNRKSLAVFLMVVLSLSVSEGGNFVGNGGDANALEFTWIARIAIQRLNLIETGKIKKSWSEAERAQLAGLRKAVNEVRVVSTEELKLEDEQVDAINYPSKKLIVLRRDGWSQVKRSTPTARFGFVLHEYLTIQNFDDRHYEISKALAEKVFEETSIDVADDEWLLVTLRELRYLLERTEKLASGSPPDVRPACFMAGSLRVYTRSSLMAIPDSRLRLLGRDPEAKIAKLGEIEKVMSRLCFAKIFNFTTFRQQNHKALVVIDALTGSLVPDFDATK